MDLNVFVQTVTDYVRANAEWGPWIVGLLAFGESVALVSLLIPATVILLGIGALIGASGLDFWPIWSGAVIGAALGDSLSYWLGFHYHEPISRLWPLSKNPGLLNRGHAFFERWGLAGVFIGRFFGPLRATVPLAAGACTMPVLHFQLANWSSAMIWAGLMLGPGAFGADWLVRP